jgi:hypothetical protein
VYVHHPDLPGARTVPAECVGTVRELGRHFEEVVVATDYTGRDFEDAGFRTIVLANDSYDAGFFYKALRELGVLREISQTGATRHGSVAVFNDSVVPVAGLAEIVAWGRASGLDMWGPIFCEKPSPHVQSYFLVFEPRAAAHLPAIFSIIGIETWNHIKDKNLLRATCVTEYELGTSQYMMSKGLGVGGQVRCGPETVYDAVEGAGIGCPVAKRKVLAAAPPSVRAALMANPDRKQKELRDLGALLKIPREICH